MTYDELKLQYFEVSETAVHLYNALQVILKDATLKTLLLEADPMAARQASEAVAEAQTVLRLSA
jgi:hypothetical protein